MDKRFKVFGEENLLQDCQINLFTFSVTGDKEENTLLNNGKFNQFESKFETPLSYKVYISYKDKHVNVLEFQNKNYGAIDQINHLYVNKKDGVILIMFIGREANIEEKRGLTVALVPIDDYFKSKNITDEKQIQQEKQKFFNVYK